MPDDSRERRRREKHRDRSDSNDETEHTHKKEKRSRIHDSEIKEVSHHKRRKSPADVIEIHASSSEDDESSSKNKRRHSHTKKAKTNENEASQKGESSNRDSGKRQPRRSDRSRSRSQSDDRKKKRHGHEATNDTEVRVKEEKTNNERRTDRSRNRDERPRRFSPDRRREVKREDHNHHPRDDRRYNDRDRNNRGRRGGGGGRFGRNPRNRDDEQQNFDWGKSNESPSNVKKEPTEKAKPDFKLSGKLTEERNTYKGVVIKYSEPPEARIPKKRWRLYQFKGDETLPTLYIHRQSAYLIGRDRKIADIPIDHPSCSKQHAALQYRLINYERPNGSVGKQIRLYVIDLESANGTFINGNKIDPKRYVELMEKDVVKFGFSSREYVLLHEHSKGEGSSSEAEDNAE